MAARPGLSASRRPKPLQGITFPDPRRGWVVGNSGAIYRTVDWGASWSKQTSGTSAKLNDVFFVDTVTGWAVGDAGVILRTTDGATWRAQSSGTSASLNSVDFLDAGWGWAAGSGGAIVYTTDGGAHWLPAERITSAGITDLDMISTTDGWAVGESGILLHFSGLAAERTVTALRAGAGPVVDGKLAEWQALSQTLLNKNSASSIAGQIPTYADLSAGLRTAWAPDRLYFAASITDDVLVGNDSTQIWGDDVLELGIRVGSTTHQFTLAVDGRKTDNGVPITSLTYVTRTVPGGWTLEVAIPAAAIGLTQPKLPTRHTRSPSVCGMTISSPTRARRI